MSENAHVGVKCYRVITHRFEGQSVDVKTWSLAPRNTNIEKLLKSAAPSTRFLNKTPPRSTRYQIGDSKKELAIVQQLLRSLQAPRVVAMVENFTLAVCLDFYKNPPESPDGNLVWTEIGESVRQAKYGESQREKQEAIQMLTERAVSYVSGNPLLRRANGAAIVPPSKAGKETGPLLASIAQALSAELGIYPVNLQRRRSTEKAQKNVDLDKGDNPELNQRDTMVVVGNSPERVLVVDDLMGYGDSVREAGRALQKSGTTDVTALVLAKDRTGTRGYASPED